MDINTIRPLRIKLKIHDSIYGYRLECQEEGTNIIDVLVSSKDYNFVNAFLISLVIRLVRSNLFLSEINGDEYTIKPKYTWEPSNV